MHLRLSGAADLQVHSVIYPLHLRVKITIFLHSFLNIDTQNIFCKSHSTVDFNRNLSLTWPLRILQVSLQ